MIPLKLWYSDEQTEGDIAHTHDELDAVLDRVAALSSSGWPALAEVTQAADKFGPLMYVGFHEYMGALMYPEIDTSAYTVGEGTQDGDPLLYMQGTSDSEFPPNSEVPAALIRQATHEFADTGRRPTCVPWQTWERPDATTDSEWPDL
jgi:hypothetical protein